MCQDTIIKRSLERSADGKGMQIVNAVTYKLMYKTAVYTLVNGANTHQKPQI